jgi:hypothetical protein
MPKQEEREVDPDVAAFFKEIVSGAFEIIINEHLKNSVVSKTRIDSDSAEILVLYNPTSDKKAFIYRLQERERILMRKSFYTNRMYETPASDNDLISDDYSSTTVEKIVVDFVTQYRDHWPTKPLGEPPSD